MIDAVDEVSSEIDCDRNTRNGRLAQLALTRFALLLQEIEQTRAHGRFALEIDCQDGVIKRIRRTACVTEL